MTWKMSLVTVCAPWLPLAELAPQCVAAGLHGLDLSVKAQSFDATKPVNCWQNNAAILPAQDLETASVEAAAILTRHGLACRMLSSYAMPSDLAEAQRLALAARTLAAPMVRIWNPAPEPGHIRAQVAGARADWRRLAELAAAHDIRMVFELHDRTITTGASAAMRLLDGLDPAQVGVILDIANTAVEGNEPLALAVELLGPYLAHVHVKDVAFQAGDGWNGQSSRLVALGQGDLRWPLCLRILREAGYDGWLAIEHFTGLEQGPARIAGDAAWLRATIEESQHA